MLISGAPPNMRCGAGLRAKLPLSFVSFCASVADGDETTAPVATVKMAVPTIHDRTFFVLTLLKVKDFEGLDAVLIRRFTRRLHGSLLPALPLECLRVPCVSRLRKAGVPQ